MGKGTAATPPGTDGHHQHGAGHAPGRYNSYRGGYRDIDKCTTHQHYHRRVCGRN